MRANRRKAVPLAAGLLAVLSPILATSAPASLRGDVVAQANPAPSFLTYERPANYQAVVTKNIEVPLRDGSYLSCDLYRPGETMSDPAPGRFPGVVFQYHGYGANRFARDPPELEFLAQHGYNAVQCSVRGTGGSPGTIDIIGPQEGLDGYDIVEWLALQPWSTGDVGMVGYSFGGITTYLTASQRPPHLRTIVPQASYSDLYRDIAHLGGVRCADVRAWFLGLLLALNSVGTPAPQLIGIEQQGLRFDQEAEEHLLDDAHWRRYAFDYDAIESSGIPILAFGGWYDIYQRGMPAAYQRLPEQTWLVMNNVSHVETINPTFFGSAEGPTLAWLDRWLMHLGSAPLPSTHVTSYEMPGTGGRGWTELDAWPPPGVRRSELHLNADGALAPQAGPAGSTAYQVNPFDGMPSYWNVGLRPDSPPIVAWNTALESERLRFATGTLEHDLVLAGAVRARIKADFSADDGYLVARLSDVAPDGSVTLVGTGWRQTTLSPDHKHRVRVPPGQQRFYDIEIWPSHWRFLAGHRLQVSISSGDVPRIHPDAPSGTVTIHTGAGGSSITLPVLQAGSSSMPSPSTEPRDVAAGRPRGGTGRGGTLAGTGVTDARILAVILLAAAGSGLVGLRRRS